VLPASFYRPLDTLPPALAFTRHFALPFHPRRPTCAKVSTLSINSAHSTSLSISEKFIASSGGDGGMLPSCTRAVDKDHTTASARKTLSVEGWFSRVR
jgi:hypothetical protein